MRVTNGIPRGSLLLLPVDTVNCVQTLKALQAIGATAEAEAAAATTPPPPHTATLLPPSPLPPPPPPSLPTVVEALMTSVWFDYIAAGRHSARFP
jgi:hypothetical protein